MNHSQPAKLPTLFALTLLLSAALLFLVQPMFSKMVLPLFGGAPAVWNTCMLFFQTMLLAGYAYAHLVSTRLPLRWQLPVHGAILLLPLASLPIAVAAGWEPPGEAHPAPWLLGLLSVSVGLPFFAVATTAPLLQSWFARLRHSASGDPYFLYSASNVGSLTALLAYPLVLEPLMPLQAHSLVWTGGYGLLIILIAACGIAVWRIAASPALPHSHTPALPAGAIPLTWRTRLHWLALAFVPSSLMLSVTLFLTTDLAAIPLLWVIPLALYLLTFVLAFARRQWLPAATAARVMPLVVLALVLVMVSEATEPVGVLMVVHLATFFIVALVCHGELARLRPPPSHLTEFYLWLSLGGILGGVFNSLIAPVIFDSLAEYPLVLVLACLLRPAPQQSEAPRPRRREKPSVGGQTAAPAGSGDPRRSARFPPLALDLLLPAGLLVVAAALVVVCEQAEVLPMTALAIEFAVPALICYLFLYRPVRFGLGIAALLAASLLRTSVHGEVIHSERSFFGLHRVSVDTQGEFVQLVHGNTLHGRQRLARPSASNGQRSGSSGRIDIDEVLAAPREPDPLTYYHRRGPIGQVFALPQLEEGRPPVAVIGLGTGSLAAYAKIGQRIDFYEIDPVVQKLAEDRRFFTFLGECQGEYRVILGDARLKLRQAEAREYGLIVVDAFSSDAVPLHLLTQEAIELYLGKLRPEGMVAFNVSNRYLDLAPVLGDLAGKLDLACLANEDVFYTPEDLAEGKTPSIWVVLSRKEGSGSLAAEGWEPVAARPGQTVWTDDHANIAGALRWLGQE